MSWTCPPPPVPSLAVSGGSDRIPVRRIFCVGRNYADHAREMGAEVERGAPFFFTKSAHALLEEGTLPYPSETGDFHHEGELAVILTGGPARDAAEAEAQVWGYAAALDMTRRDLQAAAKAKGHPWSAAKDFDGSAVIGPVTPKAAWGGAATARLALRVNGTLRQAAPLSDMVWPVAELIVHLARLYRLEAGDVLMTGTPAGVGAVVPGDRIALKIDGLEPLEVTISP